METNDHNKKQSENQYQENDHDNNASNGNSSTSQSQQKPTDDRAANDYEAPFSNPGAKGQAAHWDKDDAKSTKDDAKDNNEK